MLLWAEWKKMQDLNIGIIRKDEVSLLNALRQLKLCGATKETTWRHISRIGIIDGTIPCQMIQLKKIYIRLSIGIDPQRAS